MDRVSLFRNTYRDSAFLMQISRRLRNVPTLSEAVVLMGTPMNRELLRNIGFSDPEIENATPLDLIVALRGNSKEPLSSAEKETQRLLRGETGSSNGLPATALNLSLESALALHPEASLVSISVPGAYAAYVTDRALEEGRHVFLFSNNVSLDDEIALKKKAQKAGLLLMGPDCGTAILSGVGLGFSNRVPRGEIGIVGASGTGIQELCCLLAARSQGVSHAIGTGSRDLSLEVNGIMTEFGLRLLGDDGQTRSILLVAKHPAPAVAKRLHRLMVASKKPVVVRYLGEEPPKSEGNVRYAATLDEAAFLAASRSPKKHYSPPWLQTACPTSKGSLVGVFSGGSLLAETKIILGRQGIPVTPLNNPWWPGDPLPGHGNLLIDVGEDFYTQGRPHPMVDQTLRCEMLEAVAANKNVSLLLFDLVLGDGAHPDPAPELVQALLRGITARKGKPLTVVASLTGTKEDPQDANRQQRILSEAGVLIETSASRAATSAALYYRGGRP
jgi:FdrA protein